MQNLFIAYKIRLRVSKWANSNDLCTINNDFKEAIMIIYFVHLVKNKLYDLLLYYIILNKRLQLKL